MRNEQPPAHFDNTLTAVEIERLTVRDKDVAREAQRWTAGGRGAAVDDPDTLAAADLSQFVTEAVIRRARPIRNRPSSGIAHP